MKMRNRQEVAIFHLHSSQNANWRGRDREKEGYNFSVFFLERERAFFYLCYWCITKEGREKQNQILNVRFFFFFLKSPFTKKIFCKFNHKTRKHHTKIVFQEPWTLQWLKISELKWKLCSTLLRISISNDTK